MNANTLTRVFLRGGGGHIFIKKEKKSVGFFRLIKKSNIIETKIWDFNHHIERSTLKF